MRDYKAEIERALDRGVLTPEEYAFLGLILRRLEKGLAPTGNQRDMLHNILERVL